MLQRNNYEGADQRRAITKAAMHGVTGRVGNVSDNNNKQISYGNMLLQYKQEYVRMESLKRETNDAENYNMCQEQEYDNFKPYNSAMEQVCNNKDQQIHNINPSRSTQFNNPSIHLNRDGNPDVELDRDQLTDIFSSLMIVVNKNSLCLDNLIYTPNSNKPNPNPNLAQKKKPCKYRQSGKKTKQEIYSQYSKIMCYKIREQEQQSRTMMINEKKGKQQCSRDGKEVQEGVKKEGGKNNKCLSLVNEVSMIVNFNQSGTL